MHNQSTSNQNPTFFNVFSQLKALDGLISRTRQVENIINSTVTTKWIVFSEPKSLIETELLAHFPSVTAVTDTNFALVDMPVTADMMPRAKSAGQTAKSVKPKGSKHRDPLYNEDFLVEYLREFAPTPQELGARRTEDVNGGSPFTAGGDLSDPQQHQLRVSSSPNHAIDQTSSLPSMAARTKSQSKLWKKWMREPTNFAEVPDTMFELGEIYLTVLDSATKSPLQKFPGTIPLVVPHLYVEIMYGVRAMLLVLIDSSKSLNTNANGSPDPNFVGYMDTSCVYGCIDKMVSWTPESFVPNCKYWKDYPMASFLEQVLPNVPTSWTYPPNDSLFTGSLGGYWRRLCQPAPSQRHSVSKELFRAVFSIAQSKKAFAPVAPAFVDAAYEKHLSVLSQPPLPVPTGLEKFLRAFFRAFRPKDLIKGLGSVEASTSASNRKGRHEGGSRAVIRELMARLNGTNDESFVSMVETERGEVEQRGIGPLTEAQWLALVQRPLVEDRLLAYKSLGLRCPLISDEMKRTYPMAKVVGLTEPLKVRVITSMTPTSSYFLKTLQRSLWKYLSGFPCFDLTNRVISQDSLFRLMERQLKMFGVEEGTKYVSGDYRSATDLLSIEATRLVMEVIISKLSEDDKDLAPHLAEILMPQILVYPLDMWKPNGTKDTMHGLQKNGQLMGSVLSFPILCVLNLYTYFATLSPEIQNSVLAGKTRFQDLAVLINGDDILFQCSPERQPLWVAAGKSLGFELSLGKNFYHSTYFTVNSVPIVLASKPEWIQLGPFESERLPDGSFASLVLWGDTPVSKGMSRFTVPKFEILGYANVGLLTGLSKNTSLLASETSVPLNGWFEGAVVGAMNPQQMTNYFLHYHSKEIKRQTTFGKIVLNLYAHPYLGGLGFPLPEGVVPEYSTAQRSLAAHMLAGLRIPYYGRPSDHPLKPIVYHLATEPQATALGTKRQSVHTELISPIGPFNQYQSLFLDESLIMPNTLSMAYGDVDETVLTPTCRLSNKIIGSILKKAKHHAPAILDVDSMTEFPYRVAQSEFDSLSRLVIPLFKDLDEYRDSVFAEDYTDRNPPLPQWYMDSINTPYVHPTEPEMPWIVARHQFNEHLRMIRDFRRSADLLLPLVPSVASEQTLAPPLDTPRLEDWEEQELPVNVEYIDMDQLNGFNFTPDQRERARISELERLERRTRISNTIAQTVEHNQRFHNNITQRQRDLS